jgi:hypothetical protein
MCSIISLKSCCHFQNYKNLISHFDRSKIGYMETIRMRGDGRPRVFYKMQVIFFLNVCFVYHCLYHYC